MSRPGPHLLIAVLGFALVAAACGGGDDASATASPATTTTAPVASTPAPATTVPATPAAPTPAPALDRIVQPVDAISVHYVGTLDSGEQFDSSRDRGQVLSFVVAAGQMIAGFDAGVRGMHLGEIKTVRIQAADAYGEWTEDRVLTTPIDQLPDGVTVGATLTSSTGQRFIVLELGETEARLDGNHHLAGQALTFEIELVSFDSPPAGGGATPQAPEGTRAIEITSRSHVEGEIAYGVPVPAGGDHAAVPLVCGIYDQPVATENAVHSLEHGAVWITYRSVSDVDLPALRELADSRQEMILSPVPDQGSALIVTAWGFQLELSSADDPRLAEFVSKFEGATTAPEPGASCASGIGSPNG